MAITLASATPVAQGVEGALRFKVWRVNGPASYATGGTSFTPSEVGMSRISFTIALGGFYNGTNVTHAVFPTVASDGSQNMVFTAGAAANAVLTQPTAATNLSAYEGLIKVYGT